MRKPLLRRIPQKKHFRVKFFSLSHGVNMHLYRFFNACFVRLRKFEFILMFTYTFIPFFPRTTVKDEKLETNTIN